MMKLNAKVVASLFFGIPVSRQDMPSAIGEIFRWTDDEPPPDRGDPAWLRNGNQLGANFRILQE